MTTTASLQRRAGLIEAAYRLSTVLDMTSRSTVRSVRVPGHHAMRTVFIQSHGSTKVIECHIETPLGFIPCPAHGLCYHGLAAVKVAAAEAGYAVLGWAASESIAHRMLNLKQYHECRIGIVRGGNEQVWFLWK